MADRSSFPGFDGFADDADELIHRLTERRQRARPVAVRGGRADGHVAAGRRPAGVRPQRHPDVDAGAVRRGRRDHHRLRHRRHRGRTRERAVLARRPDRPEIPGPVPARPVDADAVPRRSPCRWSTCRAATPPNSCGRVAASSCPGPLDGELVNGVAAELMALDGRSADDVELVINSDGGPPADVVVLLDVIGAMRAPVVTTCMGRAKGTAAVLLACGTGRRASHAELGDLAARRVGRADRGPARRGARPPRRAGPRPPQRPAGAGGVHGTASRGPGRSAGTWSARRRRPGGRARPGRRRRAVDRADPERSFAARRTGRPCRPTPRSAVFGASEAINRRGTRGSRAQRPARHRTTRR